MLRSMTGFGAARHDTDALHVAVEVRTVNGRFLKVSLKTPSLLSAREAELEALVRKGLRRGSAMVNVYFRRTDPSTLAAVNEEMVTAYQAAFRRLGLSEDSIPLLKGVIGQLESEPLSDDEWSLVEKTTRDALAELVSRREHEGAALGEIVAGMCERIDELRLAVRERCPEVVAEHHGKLRERLQNLLDDAPVDEQLLAREIAVLADRADVTEEIDRLGAHVTHARELLGGDDAAGRALDFIAQEMLREANTIGSKSSDAQLARLVIDLKSVVEQLKEQVANIE